MADLDSFFAKKGRKKKKIGKRPSDISDGKEGDIVTPVVDCTEEEETDWKEVQNIVEISAEDLKVQTFCLEQATIKNEVNKIKVNSPSKANDMLSKGKDQDPSKLASSPWQPLPLKKECSSQTFTVTSSGSSAYVPPSRRTKPLKISEPPDITSESIFPSLILTNEKENRKIKLPDDDDVDDDDGDLQAPMYTELHLQNQFSSLRNE